MIHAMQSPHTSVSVELLADEEPTSLTTTHHPTDDQTTERKLASPANAAADRTLWRERRAQLPRIPATLRCAEV